MNFDVINNNYNNIVSNNIVKENEVKNKDTNDFGPVLNSFLQLYDKTSNYELSAEKAQLDYASGKTDDMLEVILLENKAATAVNFSVQVTNKVIDSYKQIMNIQL